MEDDRISLAHGNGGRFLRELIEEVFARHLGKDELDTQADAVPIALNGGDVLITTDGFTVQPLEFPGGDIGSLAIHGTTNDLAVAGARPLYLTLNAFIEEGLEIAVLDRIVASLARAARESGVRITAGDTKVVRRGEGGGLYLATTGVGVRLPGVVPSLDRIEDGDVMIVSGPIGDHGIAVMAEREGIDLERQVLVAGQVHQLGLQVHGHLGIGLGRELVEELAVGVLVDDDRQQAVLERVVAEDVGEAGREDGPDAPRGEGPGSMLTRRAGAEVVAREKDLTALLGVRAVEADHDRGLQFDSPECFHDSHAGRAHQPNAGINRGHAFNNLGCRIL